MNKNVIVFGGAILVSVLVVMLMSSGKEEEYVPVESQNTVKVLVASRDLPKGKDLTDGDLEWRDWPEQSVFKTAIVGQEEEYPLDRISGRVGRSVARGEPITSGVMVEETTTFLAAGIEKGKRAVAVEVDPEDIAGGLIGPGDFVDVVLTYSSDARQGAGNREVKEILKMNLDKWATETVLENIKVLAIDQTSSAEEKEKGKTVIAKTVTLAVTPKEAEILFLASRMGSVSLALRGIGDNEKQAGQWPVVTDMRITDIHSEIYKEYIEKLRESLNKSKVLEDNTYKVKIYSGSKIKEIRGQ